MRPILLAPVLLILVCTGAFAGETQVRYRVTGLFQPDRVDALREATRDWNEARLDSVDYDSAVATLAYDPDSPPFKNATPEQVLERLNNKLRERSKGVFSLLPLSTLPRASWQKVQIRLEPLDCVACSFGVYLAVHQLEGVQRATSDMKDGLLTVWIDPSKIDRQALEKALKKREVTLLSK